jgi:hypothetical protein
MAEAQAASNTKTRTEYTAVKMSDGREVQFAGKRKVLKDTILDESKILVDGDTITLQDGAVAIRMDFRNGDTRTYPLKLSLLPTYAGHGGQQKFGDQLASPASKPMSEEDMVIAVDDLHEQVNLRGDWTQPSEGGGFSGASVVIRAICEASGKAVDEVKAFLQKKLDDAKKKDEKLSRKDLYDSFRNPNSKVGKIIQRMEEERLAKESKVDADEALGELGTA